MGAVPPIRPVAGPAYYDFIASRGLPTQMAEVRCMEQGHGAVQQCRKSWQQKEGTAVMQQNQAAKEKAAARKGSSCWCGPSCPDRWASIPALVPIPVAHLT